MPNGRSLPRGCGYVLVTSSEALDLIETCACTRRVLDKGQITCLECGTIYGSLKQVYFANVVGRLKGGIHEYDE